MLLRMGVGCEGEGGHVSTDKDKRAKQSDNCSTLHEQKYLVKAAKVSKHEKDDYHYFSRAGQITIPRMRSRHKTQPAKARLSRER